MAHFDPPWLTPWFPDGDETYPSEDLLSYLHLTHGDLWQTYDALRFDIHQANFIPFEGKVRSTRKHLDSPFSVISWFGFIDRFTPSKSPWCSLYSTLLFKLLSAKMPNTEGFLNPTYYQDYWGREELDWFFDFEKLTPLVIDTFEDLGLFEPDLDFPDNTSIYVTFTFLIKYYEGSTFHKQEFTLPFYKGIPPINIGKYFQDRYFGDNKGHNFIFIPIFSLELSYLVYQNNTVSNDVEIGDTLIEELREYFPYYLQWAYIPDFLDIEPDWIDGPITLVLDQEETYTYDLVDDYHYGVFGYTWNGFNWVNSRIFFHAWKYHDIKIDSDGNQVNSEDIPYSIHNRKYLEPRLENVHIYSERDYPPCYDSTNQNLCLIYANNNRWDDNINDISQFLPYLYHLNLPPTLDNGGEFEYPENRFRPNAQYRPVGTETQIETETIEYTTQGTFGWWRFTYPINEGMPPLPYKKPIPSVKDTSPEAVWWREYYSGWHFNYYYGTHFQKYNYVPSSQDKYNRDADRKYSNTSNYTSLDDMINRTFNSFYNNPPPVHDYEIFENYTRLRRTIHQDWIVDNYDPDPINLPSRDELKREAYLQWNSYDLEPNILEKAETEGIELRDDDPDIIIQFDPTNIFELSEERVVDSIRIKEIHAALEAQTFAYYCSTETGEGKVRVANLGYYIERIAKVLGINVLADGVSYKPKQPEVVEVFDYDPDTFNVSIPAPYRFEIWGLEVYSVTDDDLTTGTDPEGNPILPNTDAPREVISNGMIYEITSNKFITDDGTGELTQIAPGGLALINNIPQLIRQIIDDLDKSLGLQESGAFALRSSEDLQSNQESGLNPEYSPKICTYEGLHSLMAEIAYMLSEISRRSSGAQISSLINNAVLYELMAILGLPIEPKYFEATIGLEEDSGEDIVSKIYHPAFSNEAPRIFELWTILMQNIAPILGQQYDLPEEEKQRIKTMSPEELETYIQEGLQEIRNAQGGN